MENPSSKHKFENADDKKAMNNLSLKWRMTPFCDSS